MQIFDEPPEGKYMGNTGVIMYEAMSILAYSRISFTAMGSKKRMVIFGGAFTG